MGESKTKQEGYLRKKQTITKTITSTTVELTLNLFLYQIYYPLVFNLPSFVITHIFVSFHYPIL